MAKPNYSYEKRQRELAKKKKQEEKRLKKIEAKQLGPHDGSDPAEVAAYLGLDVSAGTEESDASAEPSDSEKTDA